MQSHGRMDLDAPLSPAECRALLQAGGIGRVSVSIGALPAIFPVHYRLVDDDIVFRSPSDGAPGPGALDGAVIAFEADQFDPDEAGGWSVLVVGRVEPDREPGFTRVPSERISGHRFTPLGNVQR
jgi:nitroimidazol reductase NimA-like FMN-containing flavoprotein (pyridoxamine 5'-phosphate oxidase superfamily)